jgi:hypothetical protein
MNRARIKPWIVWLLPLMLLRAFVPMGFMLSGESGALAITFCSSVAAPPASDVHAAHHHLEPQSAGHHHHGSEAHEHTVCPYGLTGPAQAASVINFEVSAPLGELSATPGKSLQPSLTPSQTEPIRGPPALA